MRRLRTALLLALCAGCGETQKPLPEREPPALDFTLKDLLGKEVRLEELRGRTVLIDFWATWCDPCAESIPLYNRLYKEHKGSGFAILGINEDDDPEIVEPFADRKKIAYRVLMDPRHRIRDSYEVRRLPTAILIDRRGRIRRRWTRFDRTVAAEVEQVVAQMLR